MPSERFNLAIAAVLKHEGGFVDDSADPGGVTNFGISLRFLKKAGELDLDGDGHPDGDIDFDGDIDAEDIINMTRAQAIELYRNHFWLRYGYNRMPSGIGEKVFDLCVNMGPRQAHKLLQRALRSVGGSLVDDGVIGPKTRRVIRRYDNQTDLIVAALRSESAGFYRTLAALKIELKKYLNGWLNRAYS